MLLNKKISPKSLKTMSDKQLRHLCGEIRDYLITTVSKNGGHLASNLGTVELTVALHKVFDSPTDKIVFDVGHQCYTHKILTGRYEEFKTLRTENGIGGFPRAAESPHDAFLGGHSGIAVSAALGIAEAMRLSGSDGKTVAVVGDGAFTDGGTYEGMNNAGRSGANLIVILNDNEMSISKNTGAVAAYLTGLRSGRRYHTAKTNVKTFLQKNPVGTAVSGAVSVTKKFVRNAIYSNTLFENIGFEYYGVVDGHNLKELTEVLELAKLIDRPCLIHVKTKKGKGYKPAERNAGEYHGVTGVVIPRNPETRTGTKVFGTAVAEFAAKDEKIVLVSAAMKYATGCNYFNDLFPDRFYDCGIAEAHAVTFSAGLASQGLLPVFAVYSTFSQRCFDRLIHDCAIENRHVVLAIDRAGFVGEDGETHQGLYDVAMLSAVPNMTVFSPATADELRECLRVALYDVCGPVAVRYPRGQMKVGNHVGDVIESNGDYRLFGSGKKALNITYGRLACELRLQERDLLQLIKIAPLSQKAVLTAMAYSDILFYEEGSSRGGVGEALLLELVRRGWKGKYDVKGVTGFVPAADAITQLNNLILS